MPFASMALMMSANSSMHGTGGSTEDATCSNEVSETLGSTGLTAVPDEKAKEQALKEHRARISRAHREAAQAATNAQLARLRAAQAANMSVEGETCPSMQRFESDHRRRCGWPCMLILSWPPPNLIRRVHDRNRPAVIHESLRPARCEEGPAGASLSLIPFREVLQGKNETKGRGHGRSNCRGHRCVPQHRYCIRAGMVAGS